MLAEELDLPLEQEKEKQEKLPQEPRLDGDGEEEEEGAAAYDVTKHSTLMKKPGILTVENTLTGLAAKRVMKEYAECIKTSFTSSPLFTVELIDNKLSTWKVEVYCIDVDSELYQGMVEHGIASITLNMFFPEDYPFAPPFVHVVKPRISKGYVFSGGAICMELLTKQGWSSVYNVESVIMQFASQVVKGGGVIAAQTDADHEEPYKAEDAYATFDRISKNHRKRGWRTAPLAEG